MIKTIAIIDPYSTGHHLTYMRMYSAAILSLGHRVLAFFPLPEELKSWITSKYPNKAHNFYAFQHDVINLTNHKISAIRKVKSVLNHWSLAKKSINKAKVEISITPDVVFFCWLDAYLYEYLPKIFVEMFPYYWSGLYFHPVHLRKAVPPLGWKRFIYRPERLINSSNCKGVAILDEGILEQMRTKLPKKNILVFPDIADDVTPDTANPLVQEILAKSKGRKIVSLLGSQDNRKGIMVLMEISKLSAKENIFYVFAGKLSEDGFSSEEIDKIKKFQASSPVNCFFYLNYIDTEATFNGLISISDLLFAVYKDFPSSSNILTKAALYEKPVIVNESYCMGERVKNFRLGSCVGDRNVAKCFEEIKKILFNKEINQYGFKSYLEQHSAEKLKKVLSEII